MKKPIKTIIYTGLISTQTLISLSAIAHEDETSTLIRPDSHAPIGVMADHMHNKGEWMLGYRFAKMEMSGLINGTDNISATDVATMANPNMSPATFRVVPESMDMTMHMFGLMYAPSDRVTMIIGGSAVSKSMLATTYQGMMGTAELGQTKLKTSALNALKTVALVRLYKENGKNLHVGLGVAAPLGSIDEEGSMLMPNGMTMESTLAYPMQTGTGTWDFLPSVTFSSLGAKYGGGLQYSGRVAMGENDANYSFGDQHSFNAWVSALVHESVSVSLRLNYENKGAIEGADARISGATPGAIPAMQGRESINAGFGLNYVFQTGALKGHRLATEVIIPLYEDTNGPQLSKEYKLVTGWQYAF